jgi:type II secretory pathway component PulM
LTRHRSAQRKLGETLLIDWARRSPRSRPRVAGGVAAMFQGQGQRWIATWADPVPAEPGAAPAYLARLTSAHLAPGSNELTWDRPR